MTKNKTWTEQWWPVAYLRDLQSNRPNRFTLLARDLVLWWDVSADEWRAFEDVCPHRLVPLVKGGSMRPASSVPVSRLEFRWRRALHSDSADAGELLSGWATGELPHPADGIRRGLLFVWSGDPDAADLADLPLVPLLQEEGLADGWIVQDTFAIFRWMPPPSGKA